MRFIKEILNIIIIMITGYSLLLFLQIRNSFLFSIFPLANNIVNNQLTNTLLQPQSRFNYITHTRTKRLPSLIDVYNRYLHNRTPFPTLVSIIVARSSCAVVIFRGGEAKCYTNYAMRGAWITVTLKNKVIKE